MISFEDLLEHLSDYLNVPITPDVKGGCRLKIENKFDIQIELDSIKNHIVFGAFVYELSPGKYREEVLKAGLKANYSFQYQIGILSYVTKKNQLALWHALPLGNASTQTFIDHFLLFYHKAHDWHTSLDQGKVAPEGAFEILKQEKPPMFGLKT
ncbi:MAG: CesT family type III secretion system chaperone [Chlamydiales bacterium]|nr:CesT family type III secretion system chaperone [Chlamydiales bacterium]